MNEQLLEVVRKNLPETTAGELKKFIEQAQKNEKELAAAVSLINSQEPLLSERKKLLEEKLSVDSQKAFNESMRAELEAEKTKLKLQEKDLQITALKEVNNNMYTIMQLFVKNPRSIEIMNEHRSIPVYEPYSGGGGLHTTRSEYTNSQTEKKEEKTDANGSADQ